MGHPAIFNHRLCTGHGEPPMLQGKFHIAFATTDLKRIKAFHGGLLGRPEGRSAENWGDHDFFGNHLIVQEVPKLIKTGRMYNPQRNVPVNTGTLYWAWRIGKAAR